MKINKGCFPGIRQLLGIAEDAEMKRHFQFSCLFFLSEAAQVEQPREVQEVRKKAAETLISFPGPFTLPSPLQWGSRLRVTSLKFILCFPWFDFFQLAAFWLLEFLRPVGSARIAV